MRVGRNDFVLGRSFRIAYWWIPRGMGAKVTKREVTGLFVLCGLLLVAALLWVSLAWWQV
eukprot:CAMPEP_0119154850 /NCGR_PEP_ID=MMETSP1310-20130426/51373_1 /TAXON_ID=464262 /ORGANISM="Genus nov. species nov., Strain RCC2339" /LENGTH=59 /DNA_ID=CAMNT_0007147419 /DNA_START=152 /DNA_END=327 /DNA_ORIENTATION=+